MKSVPRSSMYFFCLLVIFINFFVGCSTSNRTEGSGFLGDHSIYSALQDHPKFDGVRVVNYRSPSSIAGASFILPPVKVFLNQAGREQDIDRKELTELAVFFHNKVFEALRGEYTLTHLPGPGVYTLRLALTDANPNIRALNIHPGTVMSGVGLGGATVEMAIEDSTTGETVMAATGTRKGKRYRYQAGLSKWGHTEGVLEDFAGLIRQRLDEINGKIEVDGE